MGVNDLAKQYWPQLPLVAEGKLPKGWTVRFAEADQGRMPALEDLDRLEITEKELKAFRDAFNVCRIDGYHPLVGGKIFVPFIGDDKGYGEFRRKANQGIRVTVALENGQQMLLLTAFQKPARPETPAEEKTRWRKVLDEHRRLLRERAKKGGSRSV